MCSISYVVTAIFCLMLPLSAALPAGIANNISSTPEKRFFRELFCDAADFFGVSSDNIESYSPVKVNCPKEYTWIRPADSLSQGEQDYLKKRRPLLEERWAQRIKDVGLKPPPRLPVVALALSGGGYRAMVSGAGMAFQQNNSAGSVGDLLGISTYASGLSGGSWALSSFYANNGKQPSDLAKDVSIIEGSTDSTLTSVGDDRCGICSRIWSFPATTRCLSSLILDAAYTAKTRRVSRRNLLTTGV